MSDEMNDRIMEKKGDTQSNVRLHAINCPLLSVLV